MVHHKNAYLGKTNLSKGFLLNFNKHSTPSASIFYILKTVINIGALQAPFSLEIRV